jgi:hypothetical protein
MVEKIPQAQYRREEEKKVRLLKNIVVRGEGEIFPQYGLA